MSTATTFNLSTAQALPNGAHILSRKLVGPPTHTDLERWVVLAQWGEDFVTWCSDADGNAYWGHYFSNGSRANHDFDHRLRRGF